MESFLNDINGIHGDIVEAELNADKLIAGFEIQFQQLLQKYAPIKVTDTPLKPNKKKLKNRIERTGSQDVDETINSVSLATSSTGISIATGSNDTDIRIDETQQYMRPVRTARKQITSMKEPTLNRKMRRDADPAVIATVKIERVSNNDIGSSASVKNTVETTSGSTEEPMPPPPSKKVPAVKVKLEKLSLLTKKSDASSSSNATASSNANETTVIPSAPTSKRKSSDEGVASIGEREEDASTSKKSNDSIEIITTEARVIELSDEERGSDDEQRMPPPAIVPPVVKPKERKQPTSKSSKLSSVSDSGSETAPTKRSTRSKQPRPRIIKQEPVDETPDTISSLSFSSSNKTRSENETETNSSRVASTVKPTKETKNAFKDKTSRAMNISGESLYEDAISEQPNRMFNSYVRIEKVPDVELPSSQQSDATFISTTGEMECNALSPRATYVIPKNAQSAEASCNPNATFQVSNETVKALLTNDQTIVMATKSNVGAVRKNRLSAASIMTEDDSDSSHSSVDEPSNDAGRMVPTSMKTAAGATKKNTKELFNPCGQKTTVKQKAEAFEKLASPVPTPRETRTRTRQLTNTDADKFVKPQTLVKTTSTTQLRTNSATRLAQSSSKYPSASSLQKAQSVEEIRKKNQAVVDEKKKKRDEKLRQIQMQREAVEQEKAEKLRKIFLEKEQRIKENQQKKHQEEIRKQQEQKRREAEREQNRKELKAAADRKERENLKILAEQKALQEKLKANKRAAESETAHYQKTNPYNFDMIESGDSTDDEGKESRKRPLPPAWSLSHNRLPYIVAQSNINSKVIDNFFSVEPRQVNLREIFPTIDDKHLRRNSSAVWNTPPRYSLMPKY